MTSFEPLSYSGGVDFVDKVDPFELALLAENDCVRMVDGAPPDNSSIDRCDDMVDIRSSLRELAKLEDQRYYHIIEARYGEREPSLREIAPLFGLTPERVRQLEAKALQFLGSCMTKSIPRPSMAMPKIVSENPKATTRTIPTESDEDRIAKKQSKLEQRIDDVPYQRWQFSKADAMNIMSPHMQHRNIYGGIYGQVDMVNFIDHVAHEISPYFSAPNLGGGAPNFDDLKLAIFTEVDFSTISDIHIFNSHFRPTEVTTDLGGWFTMVAIVSYKDQEAPAEVFYINLSKHKYSLVRDGKRYGDVTIRSSAYDQRLLSKFYQWQNKYLHRIDKIAREINTVLDSI